MCRSTWFLVFWPGGWFAHHWYPRGFYEYAQYWCD